MNNFLNLLFSIFNSLQKLYLGHFGGCSSSIPCPEDEGDCDKDSQCKEGLKCGINNCPVELQYEPFFDCCYKPCEGIDCCSADHPCAKNQGDCDFNYQCQFGLRCGSNNCPTNSSYLPTDDCCTDEACDGGGKCCTIDFQCGDNEGDCDNHNQCKEGLKCGSENCDISLGFASTVDCCYSDVDFCKTEKPCKLDEGDCNSHEECQIGLVCGSNNCPRSVGFDWFDCCYNASVGDAVFCASGIPCGEDEGDCDSDSQCQSNHFCGSNNCPASLGFETEIDCCSSTQIMSQNYPNPYPDYVEDTWLLTAPTESIIKLQFQSFNVRYFFN